MNNSSEKSRQWLKDYAEGMRLVYPGFEISNIQGIPEDRIKEAISTLAGAQTEEELVEIPKFLGGLRGAIETVAGYYQATSEDPDKILKKTADLIYKLEPLSLKVENGVLTRLKN